ncbi:helix-turn-helix domain-containing protein [Paucibacter sp. R3-3]|uniref:Helix-turn-helix domain-containing protein n=1 Tax=Roseateles agri TaxID=3098619 RepID=A0ABU5DHN8_9BURK|nr:helix-turn-helix domain-containing protein [Paucibacter sp. R3-3]MDY0744642.1 helix-turn-helix domain-containing protein [Paucibacter sp. R3-3]
MPLPTHTLVGRDPIESLFEKLNRAQPSAQRQLTGWGSAGQQQSIRMASIPMTALPDVAASQFGDAQGDFIAEGQSTFGLDVQSTMPDRIPPLYSITLVVSGTMSLNDRQYVAGPGEGLLLDTASIDLSIAPGTHFVEVNVSRAHLQRMGAELAPGSYGGGPRLNPLLPAPLVRKLNFMSMGMTEALLPDNHGIGQPLLFQRWAELIALSLLDTERLPAADPAAARAEGTPAALRRALEFIRAHAQTDIGLVEIAEAACVSVSTLKRLFAGRLAQSPGAYLRQVRLDHAREELRAGMNRSVRETALRWGFQNASKFSQAYAQRFGERPSDTRLRRR